MQLDAFKSYWMLRASRGNLPENLDELIRFLDPDSEAYSDITYLRGGLNTISQHVASSFIPADEAIRETGKVLNSVIGIIEKLQDKDIKKGSFIKFTNLDNYTIQSKEEAFFEAENKYISRVKEVLFSDVEQSQPASTLITAIIGMAGVGKTFLATKIATEYARNENYQFNIVWFINSASPADIIKDLRKLAEKLPLLPQDEDQQFLLLIKDFLTNTALTWLLIFDNACDKTQVTESPSSFFKNYFPEVNRDKKVIVTSQNTHWMKEPFKQKKYILMELWTSQDYVEFLQKQEISFSDIEEVKQLYTEFKGLPLAAAKAASYMSNMDINLRTYLRLLKENKPRLLAMHIDKNDEDLSVINAIYLSFSNLSPGAQMFMNLISFFAPDDIPIETINTKFSEYKNKSGTSFLSENPFNGFDGCLQAKRNILKYSLANPIDQDQQLISVHRLTGEAVQIFLKDTPTLYVRYLKEALVLAITAFDYRFGIQKVHSKRYAYVLPHALSILALAAPHYEAMGDALKLVVKLTFQIGHYYWKLGIIEDAIKMYDKALEINHSNDQQFDMELDVDIKRKKAFLFNALELEADFCIAVLEKSCVFYKEKELWTKYGNCCNELALIYTRKKDFDLATQYFEEALRYTDLTGSVSTNFAKMYMEKGNYEKAIELLNWCIEKKKGTKPAMLHLGVVYGIMGEFEQQRYLNTEALLYYEQAGSRRSIAKTLFYLMMFDLDNQTLDNLTEYWEKFQSCFRGEMKLTHDQLVDILLRLRLSILEKDYNQVLTIYDLAENRIDQLKRYSLSLIPTSAFLDVARYFYENHEHEKAKTAALQASDFIGDLRYHRREELMELLEKLK